MVSLVACVGNDLGTVKHVEGIINGADWDTIYIVSAAPGSAKLSISKKAVYITLDPSKMLVHLVEDLKSKIKIADTEVGVNFVSGSGKLHMAVLSALLKSGLGIRLVALTPEGVKEI